MAVWVVIQKTGKEGSHTPGILLPVSLVFLSFHQTGQGTAQVTTLLLDSASRSGIPLTAFP